MTAIYEPWIKVRPIPGIGWGVYTYNGEIPLGIYAVRQHRHEANEFAVAFKAETDPLFMAERGISGEIELAEGPGDAG